MSKSESDSTLAEIVKKVAVLASKITAQSTIIEAQNKKLDDQQKVINEMSTNIIDQKRVVAALSANIDTLVSSMCASSRVTKSSEVKLAAEPPATRLSPSVTERAKRATARSDNKAGASGSSDVAKTRRPSPMAAKKETPATVKTLIVPNVITSPMPVNNNITESDNVFAVNNEDKWTIVGVKGNARKEKQLKEVKKGGNLAISSISAIEKKKYLHVWFLHPDTTVDKITKHVESICKSDDIKVDKIKPKVTREYSSFLIGVPESTFDALSKPEAWPVHTEFSEWVWFRKTATETTPVR